MERREFLSLMAAGTVAAIWPPKLLAADARYDRLLVLIELKGGNDGLNTVVPYSDQEYARLRPRLALPREQLIQLSGREALHPALTPLLPLWQGGEMAIVQGVGYAQPNLSHFRSIEIWDTASDADQYLDAGWLSRAFAHAPPPRQLAAEGVVIGNSDLGPLSGGKVHTIALSNPESFLQQAGRIPAASETAINPAMAHILRVRGDVLQAAGRLKSTHVFRTDFPRHAFGNSVRAAAQVAASRDNKGSGGVAVIRLTHGGFDTHANQLPQHRRLLTELAEGVAALKSALTELGRWDSTLVLSYAEFGRRPAENGSGGTDHGTANVHFAFGGRVKGGIYGKAPDLARLENGNLVHGVDFRSLYATVLARHWNMDASKVLGQTHAQMDFLRPA